MKILDSISRAMLLLALMVGGCAVLDPSPEAEIGKPAPPTAGPKSGKEIYDNLCTTCHNVDGSPVDSATVLDLRNYTKSFPAFDSTLNNGPGAMPIYPYTEIDSAARQRLFDHIRTFH